MSSMQMTNEGCKRCCWLDLVSVLDSHSFYLFRLTASEVGVEVVGAQACNRRHSAMALIGQCRTMRPAGAPQVTAAVDHVDQLRIVQADVAPDVGLHTLHWQGLLPLIAACCALEPASRQR